MNAKSKIPNFFKYSQTTVDTSRSGFKYDQTIKGSCMLGRLVPIGAPIPVLPGDTFSLNLQGLFRSGTLIAPILDDMFIDVMACWVPDRIVWNNYLQWLGENEVSAWTQTVEREIPNLNLYTLSSNFDNYANVLNLSDFSRNNGVISPGYSVDYGNFCLLDHFGLLTGLFSLCLAAVDNELAEEVMKSIKFSVLEARAYYAVWNNIWRDANWQRPVLFSKGDSGDAGEYGYWLGDDYFPAGSNAHHFKYASGASCDGGDGIPFLHMPLMPSCKFHDAANSVLPQPQAGTAVELGISGTAPVIGASDMHSLGTYGMRFGGADNSFDSGDFFIGGSYNAETKPYGDHVIKTSIASLFTDTDNDTVSISEDFDLTKTNLVTDLSQASAITINDFRKLILLQEYKEMLARGGQHAEDIINTFFGVSDSKVLVTKPEILSHQRQQVGISQIVSTADTKVDSTVTHLGETGGYSITGLNMHLLRKTFTEHGHIVLVFTIRQLETYSQEIPEQFLRIGKFDRFWRIFDHIGEQEFKYMFINGGSSYFNDAIGYQESWYSYRTQRNIVTGALNPAHANSLNFWTLSNVFDSETLISPDFFCATPANLDRALIVKHYQAPQFIYDLRVVGEAYRGMSAHSYPLMFGRY